MLSISELGRFYYLPGFHDMRCKYGRVLSVIRQQMNREPQAGEVYIMMSKDLQTVRLYGYERHSCGLYEKRIHIRIGPQAGALGEHAPSRGC